MNVTCIKMSKTMWQIVKAVAALESMRSGKNVSASELVRRVITEMILKPNTGLLSFVNEGIK